MDEMGFIMSEVEKGDKKRDFDEDSAVILAAKKAKFQGLTPLKSLTHLMSPSKRPFRVSVEGNIGAGKSTLIKHFSDMQGIETYPEPIAWWRNLEGHNLLELLYKDIHKWHNVFQTYVQLTRLNIQMSPPPSGTKVQLYERSVQNNRFCFVEQAHEHGLMHDADYYILDRWYRWIRDNVDISLDLIVYLRSTPEIVFERTKARGRPEETGVTLQYLTQLHNAHEQWLMTHSDRFNNVPVLILDADKDLHDVLDQYKKNESKILGFDRETRPTTDDNAPLKAKRVLNL